MKINTNLMLFGAGACALLLIGWYAKTKISDALDVVSDPEAVRQMAINGAGAVVGAADGLIVGSVTAAGKAVGVPETNMTECERAMAEGRTWDASFACPASDFLKYVWN